MSEVITATETLVAKLNKSAAEAVEANSFPFHSNVIAKVNKKYIKLINTDEKGSNRSVLAFVDKEAGQVFKPAGWAAPAQHARGNVLSTENGLEAFQLSHVTWSVKYLR